MYKINKNIEIEDVEEGKCLIDEINERIFLFREIESKVLDYVLEHPIHIVKKIVKQEYEGEKISEDIDVFVQDLCKKGIIEWVE